MGSEVFCIFAHGGERFALPARAAARVVRAARLTPLAHAPACLAGLTDGGLAVLRLDAWLRPELGAAPAATGAAAIVVVDTPALRYGVLADGRSALGEMQALTPAPAPPAAAPFVAASAADADGAIAVLDPERLAAAALGACDAAFAAAAALLTGGGISPAAGSPAIGHGE